MEFRFCDEFDGGFGWITSEALARTSHALVVGGGVWLVDPVTAPGVEDRVSSAGEPRGVIQLLDRHSRDCAELAARLSVPHFEVPFEGFAASPFEFLRIARSRFWREVALWWPERRVLVTGDAFGTVGYYVAPGERLGVHPLLRLVPPRHVGRLSPSNVLCGHGEGVLGADAAPAVEEALATAWRRLPQAWIAGMRYWSREGRS